MTAQRTIRFYELVNSNNERYPKDFPFKELLEEIRDLNDEEAYVSVGRMEVLGSVYDPPKSGSVPSVSLFMLDRITRDVRLRIERRRNYRPLVLDPDETLAEPTFYSIFDRNVVGVMRNSGSAPGPASFRDYINSLGLVDGGVNVEPLVDRNGLRALLDVDKLTKLSIQVGPDVNSDIFGRSTVLFGAIREVRRNLGSVGIELSLRIAPKGQAEASEVALEEVKDIFTSDAYGYLDKAEIRYRSIEDGRARSHDFLQEAVAISVPVELSDQTSQPTEVSVAHEMSAAYEELHDDILSALNAKS